jgi:hypothetical protein
LPCCACVAYARDLALELFALYATIAFDNDKEEEEEEVKDELVPMPKPKTALREQAL